MEQLPVGDDEFAIDDDPAIAGEVHEQNDEELNAVFGEPDTLTEENQGDSGTDAVPSGEEQ